MSLIFSGYNSGMADESGNFLVEGLDREDLNLLRERGVDLSALLRAHVHERAQRIRAEDGWSRMIDEVAASDRFGRATTEEIVAGIHADRREAGWE
jgi:post-segregation antitoxin (ccd killing protein)